MKYKYGHKNSFGDILTNQQVDALNVVHDRMVAFWKDYNFEYGFKAFNDRFLSDRQVDALNAVQDRIDSFEEEGKPVSEHLVNGRRNLFVAFILNDWSASDYCVKPQQALCGVQSDTLSIYNRDDRLIGYCPPEELGNVSQGNLSGCEPVAGWENTFSPSLIKKWGLERRSAVRDEQEVPEHQNLPGMSMSL